MKPQPAKPTTLLQRWLKGAVAKEPAGSSVVEEPAIVAADLFRAEPPRVSAPTQSPKADTPCASEDPSSSPLPTSGSSGSSWQPSSSGSEEGRVVKAHVKRDAAQKTVPAARGAQDKGRASKTVRAQPVSRPQPAPSDDHPLSLPDPALMLPPAKRGLASLLDQKTTDQAAPAKPRSRAKPVPRADPVTAPAGMPQVPGEVPLVFGDPDALTRASARLTLVELPRDMDLHGDIGVVGRLCATVPGAAVPSRGAASAAVALDLKGEVYALSALPLAGTAMVVQMHGKGDTAVGRIQAVFGSVHNAVRISAPGDDMEAAALAEWMLQDDEDDLADKAAPMKKARKVDTAADPAHGATAKRGGGKGSRDRVASTGRGGKRGKAGMQGAAGATAGTDAVLDAREAAAARGRGGRAGGGKGRGGTAGRGRGKKH